MVMIKNLVIEGEYKGKVVNQAMGKPYIQIGLIKSLDIIPRNVSSFNFNPPTRSGEAKAAKAKGMKLIELYFQNSIHAIVAVDSKMYKLISKSLNP